MAKNQKYTNLQTGMPKGTFSYGDRHPIAKDRYFVGMRNKRCGTREAWLSGEAFDRVVLDSRARSRKRYEANKKLFHSKTVQWQRENPEKAAELAAKRRAKLKSNTPLVDKAHRKLIRQIYKYSKRLTACTGIKWTVDHIVPISKGGNHIFTNLQVTTASWNYRKSDHNCNRWQPSAFGL